MKTKLQKLFPGFSLVEVLAAVAIIGVVTFMAIPNIVRLKLDGEQNLARARAQTLNMAIASYVQAVGITAANSSWSGSDENKYSLIRPYIAFAPTNLSNGFMPSGYTARLPSSLTNLVHTNNLTGPDGSNIPY